jgi:hypothetical protein
MLGGERGSGGEFDLVGDALEADCFGVGKVLGMSMPLPRIMTKSVSRVAAKAWMSWCFRAWLEDWRAARISVSAELVWAWTIAQRNMSAKMEARASRDFKRCSLWIRKPL